MHLPVLPLRDAAAGGGRGARQGAAPCHDLVHLQDTLLMISPQLAQDSRDRSSCSALLLWIHRHSCGVRRPRISRSLYIRITGRLICLIRLDTLVDSAIHFQRFVDSDFCDRRVILVRTIVLECSVILRLSIFRQRLVLRLITDSD